MRGGWWVFLACLLAAGGAGSQWWHARGLAAAADARAEVARGEAAAVSALRDDLDDLLAALVDAETGQRGFLLTAKDEYLEPYRAGEVRAKAALARLRPALPAGPGTRFQDLTREVTLKAEEMAETVDRVRAGDKAGAFTIVQSDRGRRSMDRVRAAVRDFRADADARAAKAQTAAAAAEADRRTALRDAAAFVLVGGTLVVFLAGGAVAATEAEAARLRREAAVSPGG